MGLLKEYSVPTPAFKAAFTPAEAESAAKQFTKTGSVIKAQVLAGGRGKGHFEGGLKGGVQMVDSPEQARKFAEQMIGHKLITKQTGEKGRICNAVMLAERRPPVHEYYLALLNDRSAGGPAIVLSSKGGMNIEDVARDEPEAIITHAIDYERGLALDEAKSVADKLSFKGGEKARDEAAKIMVNLYKLFKEKDATQVEINPLAEVEGGEVLCMDAKLGFDENAEFRQAEVFKLRDPSQEDATEVEAAKAGLNFIKLCVASTLDTLTHTVTARSAVSSTAQVWRWRRWTRSTSLAVVLPTSSTSAALRLPRPSRQHSSFSYAILTSRRSS